MFNKSCDKTHENNKSCDTAVNHENHGNQENQLSAEFQKHALSAKPTYLKSANLVIIYIRYSIKLMLKIIIYVYTFLFLGIL